MEAKLGFVTRVGAVSLAAAWLAALSGTAHADKPLANQLTFSNATGVQRTLTLASSIDTGNPFFLDLGTNGRTCFSCHRPAQGWSITPEDVQARFEQTRGLDPIFRVNDGSNCEGANVSSLARRRDAFSLLLSKGLIRVELTVPADAEFEVIEVDDPYHCGAPLNEVSVYRRPLPTTNLKFLATVMWDGRETVPGQSIAADLLTQASSATTGHAEGAPPTPEQLQQIVDFQLGLFTAQTQDNVAGSLTAHSATGGPNALPDQDFCIGINDPLNMLPDMPGACDAPSGGLDPVVFRLFESWEQSTSLERQAVARGQRLFNTRTFVIDEVAGLNKHLDDPVGGALSAGTCTVCHDTPNVGNHSVSLAIDIGLADATRRTPDLPLYTLQNRSTFETIQTTDPGRAMITGKWADIGKFKGPILRTLSARPPFFHNGSAATLEEVVDFYDERFNIEFTPAEKADLIAFLKAL